MAFTCATTGRTTTLLVPRFRILSGMKVDSFMHHIPLALRNDGLMLAGEGLALVDNVALLHPVVQPLVVVCLVRAVGLVFIAGFLGWWMTPPLTR